MNEKNEMPCEERDLRMRKRTQWKIRSWMFRGERLI